MAGITLAFAEAQLALWLEADAKVASGQSYTIAGRSLSRVDAGAITEKINYWDAKAKSLSASAAGVRRTRYVGPK